jgi:hypothetical protein
MVKGWKPNTVCSSTRCSRRVCSRCPYFVPAFDADLELVGDQFQQGRKRRLIDAQDDTRKAQVAELHGEAQPVGRAAPLPDDGQVGFAERVVTDQLILGVRQRQQAFALGGGQD